MAVSDTPTGVLIIRVWCEPEQTPALRARLLIVDVPGQIPTVYATAAGLEDVCEEVRRWLRNWSLNTDPSGE